MFYLISLFNDNLEIKNEYELFEFAKLGLEGFSKSYIKERNKEENSENNEIFPSDVSEIKAETLKDGYYGHQISEKQVNIYLKKTEVVRGWIVNGSEYKNSLIGSFRIIEHTRPLEKENVITVKICENCKIQGNKNRSAPYEYEHPSSYRRFMMPDL